MPTRVSQLRDDLGLESIELRPNVHHGQAAILMRQGRGSELGVGHERPWVICRARWTSNEGRDDGDSLLQLRWRRPHKLRMEVKDAGHALLGHVETAKVGQAERGPVPRRRPNGGEALRMHGLSSCGLICWTRQKDSQVADMLSRPEEANACGRVNAVRRRDSRVGAEEDALRLADIEAGPASRPVESYGLQSGGQVHERVEMKGGVISMLLGGRG